ncbi:hypothetical protein CLF_106238 [Clonorchis sinensis]|uniref:Uncharacterized protein n=1 Tax=Clonorchis sinensis TaxID=79923 RepID=G7YEV0_CLOSI|nr:hypothetical protein CLF_106238 [Clonorchis sinensis]
MKYGTLSREVGQFVVDGLVEVPIARVVYIYCRKVSTGFVEQELEMQTSYSCDCRELLERNGCAENVAYQMTMTRASLVQRHLGPRPFWLRRCERLRPLTHGIHRPVSSRRHESLSINVFLNRCFIHQRELSDCSQPLAFAFKPQQSAFDDTYKQPNCVEDKWQLLECRIATNVIRRTVSDSVSAATYEKPDNKEFVDTFWFLKTSRSTHYPVNVVQIRLRSKLSYFSYVINIDNMTSVFNTDASLPHNHDLFENLVVKKRIKNKFNFGLSESMKLMEKNRIASKQNESPSPKGLLTTSTQKCPSYFVAPKADRNRASESEALSCTASSEDNQVDQTNPMVLQYTVWRLLDLRSPSYSLPAGMNFSAATSPGDLNDIHWSLGRIRDVGQTVLNADILSHFAMILATVDQMAVNCAPTMSPQLGTKRLQVSCQARRTDQLPSDQSPVNTPELPIFRHISHRGSENTEEGHETHLRGQVSSRSEPSKLAFTSKRPPKMHKTKKATDSVWNTQKFWHMDTRRGRKFLEVWYSTADSINRCIELDPIYAPLRAKDRHLDRKAQEEQNIGFTNKETKNSLESDHPVLGMTKDRGHSSIGQSTSAGDVKFKGHVGIGESGHRTTEQRMEPTDLKTDRGRRSAPALERVSSQMQQVRESADITKSMGKLLCKLNGFQSVRSRKDVFQLQTTARCAQGPDCHISVRCSTVTIPIIIIDSMTPVFNTDASLPYNHALFESLIVKKKNKDGRRRDLVLAYYNQSESHVNRFRNNPHTIDQLRFAFARKIQLATPVLTLQIQLSGKSPNSSKPCYFCLCCSKFLNCSSQICR